MNKLLKMMVMMTMLIMMVIWQTGKAADGSWPSTKAGTPRQQHFGAGRGRQVWGHH